MARLPVKKTYKLYIGGAFPRSESGRTYDAEGQNVARASRKDLRDAVRAARSALPKWAGMTAYNRGQVLYRLSQVLGASNPVAGPYFNFTLPEPTGVVGIVVADEPPLLGLVSRVAPVLVGGNTAVVLASETHPLAAIELAEAIATSDVPGGVVNLLTGYRSELAPWLAAHVDVNALDLVESDAELERAAADSVKRVHRGGGDVQSPWEVAAFLELKTVWHPIGV